MTKNINILVVDDSAETREVIKRNLLGAGYQVMTAANVAEAIGILEQNAIELVITDFKMPSANGLELVRYVREKLKHTIVMMITGYASVQGAVDAVKGGAEEYLAKPFTESELLDAVKRSLSKLEKNNKLDALTKNSTSAQYGLIGKSKPMRKIFDMIEKTAASFGTVLISGESGTGKELVARAIHYKSPRAVAPFVPINCGAIPENLFEGELFGYMKGSFTGANESRAGFLQTAEGGSVLLDEVGEMSLALQVKFLRVLQENELYMLGGRKPLKLDLRIMAASNKNLGTLVSKGAFREDLYYRLNVISIEVPPLRERGDDILLLASYFADKFSRKLGRPRPEFSVPVLDVLKNYYWPGNVRELENVIQRILVLNENELIELSDIPEFLHLNSACNLVPDRTLAQVEAEHILQTLAVHGGNKTKVAQVLGIDRKTLREKLKTISNTG
ncbi:MAG: sigma-54 dependent transcriptional regulator [Victivallaceae bacterium]|nr:sigma-54 dependent transcriptional regulator [Victivallaceae bacterium]